MESHVARDGQRRVGPEVSDRLGQTLAVRVEDRRDALTRRH